MLEAVLQVEWPLEELWSSTTGFIAIVVTAVGTIGLASRSMTVGAFAGYTAFAFYAMNVRGTPLLTNIFYVSIVLVCVGLGFKLLRLEAWGE